MTLRGFSVFLPQGSKHYLFKWIYMMVHKLEQIQHLHYYKTMFKGEIMRNLYIVGSELFREQHVSFYSVTEVFTVSMADGDVSICDGMEARKHHAED